MAEKTRTMNWKRRLAQVASLVLLGEFAFYGVFRCPFTVPYVSCGNCPVVQCPGRKWYLPIWGTLLVSAVVFGRAFCGWACPGGLVSDLLGKAALFRRKVVGVADRVLSAGKYVVLAGALVAWLIFDNPRWAIPIRTGGFFGSVGLTFEHARGLWIGRTVVVLVAIGLGVAISHAWCRYLCPTGGVLEGMNRLALFRYYKDGRCDNCEACATVCNLETRPAESNCNNCGDCAGVCPVDAIKVKNAASAAVGDSR